LKNSKKFELNCRVARGDQDVLKWSAYSQQLFMYTNNMKCDGRTVDVSEMKDART